MAVWDGGAPIPRRASPLLPIDAARARELSKDYLDQTLDHDPDRGPDQVADRTLNRDPAKKPDRESEPEVDRTVKLRPGTDEEPVAGASTTNVADATVVMSAGSTPVDASEADRDSRAPLEQTVEMRAERRVEVIIPIEMQVMIEVPGAGKISGATENMSCIGMLARLNGPIQPDSRCQVHFLSARDVSPSQVFGRVTRVAKSRFGYSVAFRFERPVQLNVTPPPPKKRP